MTDKMDYASAGVDIDLEGSAVASLISSLGKSVRPAGTPGAPVHYNVREYTTFRNRLRIEERALLLPFFQ